MQSPPLYIDFVIITRSPKGKTGTKKHRKCTSSSEYYGHPLLHHPYKWLVNSIPFTVFNSEEMFKIYSYIYIYILIT